MTTTRKVSDITVDLLTQEGTVSTVVGAHTPQTGYVVGIHGLGLILPTADPSAVAVWVANRLVKSLESAYYLGSWSDLANQVHLDVVKILTERVTAESLARKTGELAIYDLTRKVTLTV